MECELCPGMRRKAKGTEKGEGKKGRGEVGGRAGGGNVECEKGTNDGHMELRNEIQKIEWRAACGLLPQSLGRPSSQSIKIMDKRNFLKRKL